MNALLFLTPPRCFAVCMQAIICLGVAFGNAVQSVPEITQKPFVGPPVDQETADKAERVHIMGAIFIALMDEKLAFTTAQRNQLQPLAERLVLDIPDLFPSADAKIKTCPQKDLYVAAQKASDAELKPILDEEQLRRWRKLGANPNSSAVDSDDADEPALSPGEVPELEHVEQSISEVLYKREKTQREALIEKFSLQAEYVILVTGLSEERACRLKIAALGAAVKALSKWKGGTEEQMRSQLCDVNPVNIDQRLANVQNYSFSNPQGLRSQAEIDWEHHLNDELTPAQRASWQTELQACKTFQDKAITDVVVSNFDHYVHLTDDQRSKLEQLIEEVIHNDKPDISRIFSGGSRSPWYLMGKYELTPLAGVDDKELKDLLTPSQLNTWTGLVECSNAYRLWSSVQIFHDQRIRMEKAAK